MNSTQDVLEHHLHCFGQRDLKVASSDYASDAVLFTPEGPLKGKRPSSLCSPQC